MNRTDIHIGDKVQTIKGRGVVSYINDDMTFIVDLDSDHGSYYFSKDTAWKIDENDTSISDGIYMELFAVKNGVRYNAKIVNMKDASTILTNSLMDGVEKLWK